MTSDVVVRLAIDVGDLRKEFGIEAAGDRSATMVIVIGVIDHCRFEAMLLLLVEVDGTWT